MSYKPLTKAMKADIINAAKRKTFAKRAEALCEESDALAILAYDQLYPPVTQDIMSRLPDEFFPSQSVIYIKVTGFSEQQVILKSSRKISSGDNYNYHTPRLELEPDCAMAKRVRKYAADYVKLEEDKKDFIQKLDIFLSGVNSASQLQSKWPKGLAFYKHLLGEPVKNVPAVRAEDVDDVDEMIEALGC